MMRRIRTSNSDPKPDFLINKIKTPSGASMSLGTEIDGSKYIKIDGDKINNFSIGGSISGSSGIDIGNSNNTGTLSFVDFLYGVNTSQDYNVRILNNANESLLFASNTKTWCSFDNTNFVLALNFLPSADNAFSIGGASNRITQLWAVNGTIQTSDKDKKEDIKETVLGLNFIMKLKPVQWKWKDEPKLEITETYYEKERDKKGLFKKLVEKTRKKIIEAKKYLRSHHGLLNQDVEKALTELGFTTRDFAGIIIDKESGERALRYEQFIAPLIKAVQEQQQKIEELEKKISKK